MPVPDFGLWDWLSAQYYKLESQKMGSPNNKTCYAHCQCCMFFSPTLLKNKSSHHFCAAGMFKYYAEGSSQTMINPNDFIMLPTSLPEQ